MGAPTSCSMWLCAMHPPRPAHPLATAGSHSPWRGVGAQLQIATWEACAGVQPALWPCAAAGGHCPHAPISVPCVLYAPGLEPVGNPHMGKGVCHGRAWPQGATRGMDTAPQPCAAAGGLCCRTPCLLPAQHPATAHHDPVGPFKMANDEKYMNLLGFYVE